jgi:hypothetical protein
MNHRGAQINGVPAYAHTFYIFLIFFFVLCGFFLHLSFYILFFHKKCHKNKIELKSIKKIIVCLLQIFCSNINKLFDKYNDVKHKTSQHESCRSSFSLSFRYMNRLFWIRDNDPENILVQNFRISNIFTSKAENALIMTFSRKLLNTKVVDNFLSFPESTRTLHFEFVCEIYGQNTKLDRN